MTFREEFLALLKKHRIAYDERYLRKGQPCLPDLTLMRMFHAPLQTLA